MSRKAPFGCRYCGDTRPHDRRRCRMKLDPAVQAAVKKAWTPERRAAQSEYMRRVWRTAKGAPPEGTE